MKQTYKYRKENLRFFSLLMLIFFLGLVSFLKPISITTIMFLTWFIIGGFVIYALSYWITTRTFKIQINESNLERRMLWFTVWSIPVSSITNVAQGISKGGWMASRGARPRPTGFLLKANGKLYKIPNDLADPEAFKENLKSQNPNIIINENISTESGLFYGNDLVADYRKTYGVRNILITFAVVIIVVLVLSYIFSKLGAK